MTANAPHQPVPGADLTPLQKALDAAREALRQRPLEAALWAQTADLLQDARRPEEAEQHFRQAIALRPDFHQAYNGLGVLLVDQKRPAEAADVFAKAVELQPTYAMAHNNLGSALLSLGRLEEAAASFEAAATLRKDYVAAMRNLASVRARLGDLRAAVQWLRLALDSKPDSPETHAELAAIYVKQGATHDALTHYREAGRLRPGNVVYSNVIAELLWELGEHGAAQSSYLRSLAIDPHNLRANLCGRLLLPIIPKDGQDVERSRQTFTDGLQILEQNWAQLLAQPGQDIERDIQWDNFYLAYQGRDDRDLQQRYSRLVRLAMGRIAPELDQPIRSRPRRKRVHIGFASFHFYDCTAGHYFKSWVTGLDPDQFAVTVYHFNAHSDHITAEIRNAASNGFRELQSSTMLNAARTVRGDDLDVLIYPELGMHPMLYCLASLRLAPVQCSAWGHPVTTGHSNIDYFVSCADMEPVDADDHYTEKLHRLPGLGTNYALPSTGSAATRTALGLPKDKILYLIPQSLFKIHPDNDAIIVNILAAESNALVVFFEAARPELNRLFLARMQKAAVRANVDFGDRHIMLPRMNREDYLRVNQLSDVMLDTLHWSGGNTSLDALAMGLPVITLPGKFMRGRQSTAMLKALGCEELITQNIRAYEEVALSLGRDPERRRRISERIRAQGNLLFGRHEPIEALQGFLLAVAQVA